MIIQSSDLDALKWRTLLGFALALYFHFHISLFVIEYVGNVELPRNDPRGSKCGRVTLICVLNKCLNKSNRSSWIP